VTAAAVFAVFGISGVGKTTLVKRFVKNHPSYLHLQASALLRTAKATTSEALRSAPAAEIRDNQDILVTAFHTARLDAPERPVIFDGHSLIDGDAGLVIIPTDVIARLDPVRLIFVYDEPRLIHQRRISDTSRRRPTRSIEQLAEQQAVAFIACQRYAASLDLPLDSVLAGELVGLAGAILAATHD